MSARDWKPGDVAMVTTPYLTYAAVKDQKGWDSIDPSIGWAAHGDVIAARPLLVLDPEDAEQIADAARHMAEDPELAFDGEWVRVGLIWRPRRKASEDAYRVHRRTYQREHARARRAKGAA